VKCGMCKQERSLSNRGLCVDCELKKMERERGKHS
jgi:hypothetical protein